VRVSETKAHELKDVSPSVSLGAEWVRCDDPHWWVEAAYVPFLLGRCQKIHIRRLRPRLATTG
jgi:hypothetical protein